MYVCCSSSSKRSASRHVTPTYQKNRFELQCLFRFQRLIFFTNGSCSSRLDDVDLEFDMYRRDFGVILLSIFALYWSLQHEGAYEYKEAFYYKLRYNEELGSAHHPLPRPIVVCTVPTSHKIGHSVLRCSCEHVPAGRRACSVPIDSRVVPRNVFPCYTRRMPRGASKSLSIPLSVVCCILKT